MQTQSELAVSTRHKILQIVPSSLVLIALFLNHSTILEAHVQLLMLFAICGLTQLVFQLLSLCGLSFFYLHYAFSCFTMIAGFLALFFVSLQRQSDLQYIIINQVSFKLSELVLCVVLLYFTYLLVFPCLFCTGCLVFKGDYELASQRFGSIALFTYICTSVTILAKNIDSALNLDISILLLCLHALILITIYYNSSLVSQYILSAFSTDYDTNLHRKQKLFVLAMVALIPLVSAFCIIKITTIQYDDDTAYSGFFLNCYIQSPTFGISYFLCLIGIPILLSLGTLFSKLLRHSRCLKEKIYDPLEVMKVPLLHSECCFEELSDYTNSDMCEICGRTFEEKDMVIVHRGQHHRGCMRAFHSSEVGQLLDQGRRGCPHCSRNFF